MAKISDRKWFKNILLVSGFILLIGGSLFCALHDFTHNTRGSNIFAHPIGWLGIIYFGSNLISRIYKQIKYALQGRGMIVLTDEGLFIRDEFVAWKSIVSISGNKQYRFIAIETDDTKERLRRASWLSRLNYKLYGVMVWISDFDYDGSQEEFVEILIQHLNGMPSTDAT